MSKAKVHKLKSGILNSPYGFMTIIDQRYLNGYPVIEQTLEDVDFYHEVPVHWIKEKTDAS